MHAFLFLLQLIVHNMSIS